jgi:pSer/pThr/pTyr-binding forkhead associated (FHA) protein
LGSISAYLEIRRASGVASVALEGERVTIGCDPSNVVCIDTDATVSRLHAVLERYGSGWTVRDLGSRNGTEVNGEPVVGEQALHAGDELREREAT